MRKISTYFLVLVLLYTPVSRAFVPVIALGAYAFDTAAAATIRIVGSEVLMTFIARGTSAAAPFMSRVASISTSRFVTFLKNNWGKILAVEAVGSAAGIYYNSGDDTFYKQQTGDGVGEYVEGFVYGPCSVCGDESYFLTFTALIQAYTQYGFSSYVVINSTNKWFDSDLNRYYVDFIGTVNGGAEKTVKTYYTYQQDCSVNTATTVQEVCNSEYVEYGPMEETDAQTELVDSFSNMSQDEMMSVLSNNGELADELLESGYMTWMDEVYEYDVPDIGDQAWVYADSVARGIAQSTEPSSDGYVPPAMWDEAVYLSNTVAGGNQAITKANANNTSLDNNVSSPGTSTSDVNVNVDVDTSGIEQRLDTTNELLRELTSTDVVIQDEPTSSAHSFWTSSYPLGFEGIWSDFKNNLDNTQFSLFLESFKTNLSGGSIPIWNLCLDNIGGVEYGCNELSVDARVWAFLQGFMMLLAIVFARRAIFGG